MMKLNKYSWLAILPMIFSACQDDTLVENQQKDNKIYTLTANMENGAAMSRAQIQLGKNTSGEELFFWNAYDEFDLYLTGDTEARVFTIDENYSEPYEGELKSATFTTTTPVPIDEDYVAVYPSGVLVENNTFNFEISSYVDFYSVGYNHNEAWSLYLQDNMFMMADGKFEDPNDASVSFSHLCAMIRISYSNETNVEQNFNRVALYCEKESLFSSVYGYSMDDGTITTEPGQSYELYTGGLRVPSQTTTDFYILFFPEEYKNVEDACLEIGLDKNDETQYVYIDLADIKEANAGDTGLKAGKRYWFKVTETEKGLTWTNYTKTVEVDNITSFKEAMESPTVTHISLKNPIIVDGNEQVCFVPDNFKKILMSDDFTWFVNDKEYDALIVNSCPRLELRTCAIIGSDTESTTDKYLLKSTNGILFLDRMGLQAEGNMNAVNLDDNKEFYLYGSTSSINVQGDEKYAFKVNSSTTTSTVYLDEGTINGHVDYIDNYSTEESSGLFVLDKATLDGNVTVSGDNVRYLTIDLREGATYTGNRSAEVSSFVELKNMEKNGLICDIKLKNPIIIDGENQSFSPNDSKNISMSDDFSWTVNGTEYHALIINNSELLDLYHCTLVGTTELESKYLLQTNSGLMRPYYVNLEAEGCMNAMRVADAEIYMYGESSVKVESNNGYTFYITADDAGSEVNLSIEGEISGDVYFENNFDSDEGWSMLQIYTDCILNGEMITAGKNIQDLRVYLYGEYNGTKKIEADDIQDIKDVLYNETVDTIVLKNPILVTEEVYYSPIDYSPKLFMMDEAFTWSVGEEEYDALFVNTGERLTLYYCTIRGTCPETVSGKYMLETKTGSLFFGYATLDANGGMNGVKVKDSWFSLMNESTIDVESDNRVALDISSSSFEVPADVHISGTINGDVIFVGSNTSTNKPDRFEVGYNAVINGDLNASGTLDYWKVTFDATAQISGTGWDSWKTVNN